jgi:hypothetical protein
MLQQCCHYFLSNPCISDYDKDNVVSENDEYVSETESEHEQSDTYTVLHSTPKPAKISHVSHGNNIGDLEHNHSASEDVNVNTVYDLHTIKKNERNEIMSSTSSQEVSPSNSKQIESPWLWDNNDNGAKIWNCTKISGICSSVLHRLENNPSISSVSSVIISV